MSTDFKRLLIGYTPEGVNELVESLKSKHDKSIQEHEELYRTLCSEIDELNTKINFLKNSVVSIEQMEKKISDELLKAYLKSSSDIYITEMKAKELEQLKIEAVTKSEQEYKRIRETIKDLSGEIQKKVVEYRSK